jgi:hypothetical protein
MSCYQNSGQNHNITIANKALQYVARVWIFGNDSNK